MLDYVGLCSYFARSCSRGVSIQLCLGEGWRSALRARAQARGRLCWVPGRRRISYFGSDAPISAARSSANDRLTTGRDRRMTHVGQRCWPSLLAVGRTCPASGRMPRIRAGSVFLLAIHLDDVNADATVRLSIAMLLRPTMRSLAT